MIERAASGHDEDRALFARRYREPVRAYLARRWRSTRLASDVEDAVQEVFLSCFDGALSRADRARGASFRAYLMGITKNIAARYEAARVLSPAETAVLHALPNREDELSVVYERAWAQTLVKEAHARLMAEADAKGEAAKRRVDVLRMRFAGAASVESIAQKLGISVGRCYKDFERARGEFRDCLRAVVRSAMESGAPMDVDEECRRVLGLLHEGGAA